MAKRIKYRGASAGIPITPSQTLSETVGDVYPSKLDRDENGKLMVGAEACVPYNPYNGMMDMPYSPWGRGVPKWTLDATADDSDKSFTVPAGKAWWIISIHAEITASATVGNRVLMYLINNGTANVWASPRTSSIAAAQKGTLNTGVAFGSTTTTTDCPLLDGSSPAVAKGYSAPEFMLLPGYILRVFDQAAIDAAADDMTVSIHYVEYDYQ